MVNVIIKGIYNLFDINDSKVKKEWRNLLYYSKWRYFKGYC